MCPKCNSINTKVLNTWEASERRLKKLLGTVPPGGATKRRRSCNDCGECWSSTEYARTAPDTAPSQSVAFQMQ
jgi:transcriptional regulator NrdR family protein